LINFWPPISPKAACFCPESALCFESVFEELSVKIELQSMIFSMNNLNNGDGVLRQCFFVIWERN